jgi:hypothetical protein
VFGSEQRDCLHETSPSCASACPTVTLRNCCLSGVSRSTTSLSVGPAVHAQLTQFARRPRRHAVSLGSSPAGMSRPPQAACAAAPSARRCSGRQARGPPGRCRWPLAAQSGWRPWGGDSRSGPRHGERGSPQRWEAGEGIGPWPVGRNGRQVGGDPYRGSAVAEHQIELVLKRPRPRPAGAAVTRRRVWPRPSETATTLRPSPT